MGFFYGFLLFLGCFFGGNQKENGRFIVFIIIGFLGSFFFSKDCLHVPCFSSFFGDL